jgi:two-component system chemotaxis sensor kinase CheA
VVRRSIENLRGEIGITSKLGVGTTITLKLPLTLAIIDGLLVQISDDFFVIPLSMVEECVELSREEALLAKTRSMMSFRGELFSYISLRDSFAIPGDPPAIERVVLASIKGEKIGFGVDQVVGQHQTVIKTLSNVYRDVVGISGATILGDGSVALVLDVNQLVLETTHNG